jgi:16S rRNA (guanine527-N7)-methyltransferase
LNRDVRDSLRSWAQELDIEISEPQVDLLSIYLDELWDWNKKVNLTGLPSLEAVTGELVLDSLVAASLLPETGSLLDIGSGAGFPAIPLKIHKPLLDVHLFEANRKKTGFLKHVIRLMQLSGIDVLHGRIETDHFLLKKEGYDAITARAVSALPLTLKWSAPHLKEGGLILNYQGSEFEEALIESAQVMNEHKIRLDSALPYRLPGKNTTRSILIFRKV